MSKSCRGLPSPTSGWRGPVPRVVGTETLSLAGVGREAESSMREKMREWVGGMDFVSRDEFDAVKAMAIAARDENEALKKRIEALELGVKPAAAAAKAKPAKGAKN